MYVSVTCTMPAIMAAMMTGVGMPNRSLCAKKKNELGISIIGLPLVKMRLRPRPMLSAPSETMNGVMPTYAMTEPLNMPISMPDNTPIGRAKIGWTPAARTTPVIMPLKPTVEPTERSIPPVRITNNSPNATIATNEICRETRYIFLAVRNCGAISEIPAEITIRAIKIAASRFAKISNTGLAGLVA